MGCGPSKSDLTAVQNVTGMTKNDAVASYKDFKKEAGGQKIKLDKFTKLVRSMNTNKGGDSTDYAKHLFRVLDTNKDNHLTWKEVMVGFHTLSSNGDKNEKLLLVFKMFDTTGKNSVNLEDLKIITSALHKLQGKSVVESELLNKIKSYFRQCDWNGDGKITQEEFLKSGAEISEMFELSDE